MYHNNQPFFHGSIMGNGPTFPPLSLFPFRVLPRRRRREAPAAPAPPIPAVPTAEAAEELGIEVWKLLSDRPLGVRWM